MESSTASSGAGTDLLTERLRLSVPVGDDLGVLFRIHSDPRTYLHQPSAVMTTVAEARQRLADWMRDWRDDGIGYRVVRLGDEDTVIGFAGLRVVPTPDFRPDPVLNLYYRLDPAFWRRGFAVEAARAAIGAARATHPHLPITARVALVNTSSAATAAALGMEPTDWQDPDDPLPHRIFRAAPH